MILSLFIFLRKTDKTIKISNNLSHKYEKCFKLIRIQFT